MKPTATKLSCVDDTKDQIIFQIVEDFDDDEKLCQRDKLRDLHTRNSFGHKNTFVEILEIEEEDEPSMPTTQRQEPSQTAKIGNGRKIAASINLKKD